MKILADSNMPLVAELFAHYGDVQLLPGREIGAADVADADVLLVRSTTRVDEGLLAGSRVRFVGSATIGVDHVDSAWLASRQIAFANAPGCNARAVVEYDLAALATVVPDWMERRIGVVGCGNVGGRLLTQLQALDVACVGFDPLLPPRPGLVDFEAVLNSDILCVHTPLTREGAHPSWHLFDAGVLERLKPGTVLLNAGRGAVVDNQALLRRLREEGDLRVVLDVWEGEPDINLELLPYLALATPHIAGYSLAGRVRGTEMILAAFLEWLGRDDTVDWPSPAPVALPAVASLNEAILAAYPILEDHRAMVSAMAAVSSSQDERGVGALFDRLRREYPQRKEFVDCACRVDSPNTALLLQLQKAGFVVS